MTKRRNHYFCSVMLTALAACSESELVFDTGQHPFVCLSVPDDPQQPFFEGEAEFVGELLSYEPGSRECDPSYALDVLRLARPDEPDMLVGIRFHRSVDWASLVGSDLRVGVTRWEGGFYSSLALTIRRDDEKLLFAVRNGASRSEEVPPLRFNADGVRLKTERTECATRTYHSLEVTADDQRLGLIPGQEGAITTTAGDYWIGCYQNERQRDMQCTDQSDSEIAYSAVAQ